MRPGVVLAILLVLPAVALGQPVDEPRTDPFELAHPETGEPGVWIPVWVQRAELQRSADLRACSAKIQLQNQMLAEYRGATESLKAGAEELTLANEALKVRNAALGAQIPALEHVARRRWVWGWTSTSAGVVALSILVGIVAAH